ncbi:SIN3-HDAC complex-associated factor-like [Branchiostoma floridae x Branchiostoma belcheri]|nr:negative regulation of cell migration [Branchiostoma belcheri]
MFSFHKPKVYRSISGCCICGAKSSSSRFTDSAKYEVEFQKCFKLHEERSGEICNACVLLVKRWKKLPKGTDRNWHHVVDARAGPGTKTILKAKFKSKLSKRPNKRRHLLAKKKMGLLRKSRSGEGSDDVSGEEHMSDKSPWSSATPSPALSDQSDESMSACDVDIKPSKCKDIPYPVSSFLNTSYWRREDICCGIIFKGSRGEVVIDPRLLRPCQACRGSTTPNTPSKSSSNPLTSHGASEKNLSPHTIPPFGSMEGRTKMSSSFL